MKYIKFLLVGVFFGIVGTKSEFISWYRINEMFHFESFHMFGIIGSAVVVGAIMVFIIKRTRFKSMYGEDVTFRDANKTYFASLAGGTIFGFGWALTGACPGPIYILVGNGYVVYILVWVAAVLGTFAYGVLSKKLPH